MRSVFVLLVLFTGLTGCAPRQSAFVTGMLDAELTHSFVETPTLALPDMTLEEAYAEQASYVEAQVATGRSITGYKVAYATEEAQQRVGLEGPVYGTLLEGMAVSDGATVVGAGFRRFVVEAEIAVTIGTTIDRPIASVEELMPYITTVHPAIEMPDGLYGFDVIPGGVDLVAANTAAYRYALGRGLKPVGFDPSAFNCTLQIGRNTYSQASASRTMGGPYEAVLWLVQTLQDKGRTLEAGQVVLTGAPGRPYTQANGQVDITGRYTCDCGPLGGVSVVVR